jgi:hypothetical protein
MTFGHGYGDFLIDNPAAVAQCVLTRLILWQGEWYLNLRSGTPWMQEILAHAPSGVPDSVIRARILGTPFVTSMVDYLSYYEPTTRMFEVSCKLYTAFGEVTEAPSGAYFTDRYLVLPFKSPVPDILGRPPQQLLPPD